MGTSIISSSFHHHQSPAQFPALRSANIRGAPPLPIIRRRNLQIQFASRRRSTYGRDFGGELVDENMIVLRKRIHEMKMAERNYQPPAEWMEWEKQCYTSYDADICEVMGYLQTMLMSMRPSLAIGLTAMITLSVPASAAMVVGHFVEVSRMILAGMHVIGSPRIG